MFSSLSQRLGARIIDRLDLLVELSTLGEYGVDSQGVFALEDHESPPINLIARTRDDCPPALRITRSCRGAAARP